MWRDVDAVSEVWRSPHERRLADRDVAGNHHMGGDEAVILDRRVVPDVVAAPKERTVVADADVRLDDVGLEDEAGLSPITSSSQYVAFE